MSRSEPPPAPEPTAAVGSEQDSAGSGRRGHSRRRSLASLLGIAWRTLLIAAAAAMPIGGVLIAIGQKPLSDALVTGAFAMGILAVPLGLLWLALDRPEPPMDHNVQEPQT
jgi:hypothetical protein